MMFSWTMTLGKKKKSIEAGDASSKTRETMKKKKKLRRAVRQKMMMQTKKAKSDRAPSSKKMAVDAKKIYWKIYLKNVMKYYKAKMKMMMPDKIWIESERAWCGISREFLEFKAWHDYLHVEADDFGSAWQNPQVDVEWDDWLHIYEIGSYGADQVEVFQDACSSDDELHFFDAVERPSEWRKPPFEMPTPREKKKVDLKQAGSRPFRPWKHRRTIGFGRDVAVRKSLRVPYSHRRFKRRVAKQARQAKQAAFNHWSTKLQTWATSLVQATVSKAELLVQSVCPMFPKTQDERKSTDVPGGSAHDAQDAADDDPAKCKACRPAKPKCSMMQIGVSLLLLFLLFAPTQAMDVNGGLTSIRVPQFSGRKADFLSWFTKFVAVATLYGIAQAIQKNSSGTPTWGETLPADQAAYEALNDTSDPQSKLRNAWKRNLRAHALLVSCLPPRLFRLVRSSGGKAATLMRDLHDEFQPADNISIAEAEAQYAAITLRENGDPRYLRQRFAQLEAEFPLANVDDARKFAIILRVAPKKYAGILAQQQLTKGAACTPDDLLDAMDIVYRQQASSATRGTGGGSELGMAAPGARADVCWNCGHPGHRSYECTSPDSNQRYRPAGGRNSTGRGGGRGRGRDNGGRGNSNGGRGRGGGRGRNRNRNITCDECGLVGHTRENCYCLEANASRRPPDWNFPSGYQPGGRNNTSTTNTSGEQMTAHVEDADNNNIPADYELLMSNIEQQLTFPHTRALLDDPNIWIADSAASCNCTGHLQGLTNLIPAESSDGIMVGNRSVNKTEYIGNVPGVFYDQYGNQLHSGLLQEVSYSRSNAFNLISTTRLQNLGWKCVGEGDSDQSRRFRDCL